MSGSMLEIPYGGWRIIISALIRKHGLSRSGSCCRTIVREEIAKLSELRTLQQKSMNGEVKIIDHEICLLGPKCQRRAGHFQYPAKNGVVLPGQCKVCTNSREQWV